MMQTKMPPDPSQIHPVDIHLDGFLARFQIITAGFLHGRVLASALHAFITLTAYSGHAVPVLAFLTSAFGTCVHTSYFTTPINIATPPAYFGFVQ